MMLISNPADVFELLLNEGFSEEELTQKLENKIQQFHGFISKEGAIFLVAKDLGIDIQSSIVETNLYEDVENLVDYDEFTINIENLREGMTNIVLLGKVSRIFKINEFIRKDGSSGRVGSFLLVDPTGQIKIVVWDKKTEIIESDLFEVGLILRVIGGFCKKNENHYLEIHLAKKGKFILSPEEIEGKKKRELSNLKIPSSESKNSFSADKNPIKIKDLASKKGFIPIVFGRVQQLDLKEIDKKKGEKTFLLKFILSDETGSIQCLVWNMMAIEVLQMINNGSFLEIHNILLKKNSYNHEKELQFTKRTFFKFI